MRHERSRTMATVKVAEVSDVPVGTGKVVQAGGKTLALFNLGGTFHALDNRCTHMGGPLGEGAVGGHRVTRPGPRSRFNSTHGAGVRPPAHPPAACSPVHGARTTVLVDLPC